MVRQARALWLPAATLIAAGWPTPKISDSAPPSGSLGTASVASGIASGSAAAPPTGTSAPRGSANPALAAPPDLDTSSIVSFAAGARVVSRSSEWWPPELVIDGDSKTGWSSYRKSEKDQWIVIELPERSILEELRFDTKSVEDESYAAKTIRVEMSDTSPSEGWALIASATLEAAKDGQVVTPSAKVPGRWLRLWMVDSHGGRYLQLMEVRARGKQLTKTPTPSVSGTWRGSESLHLEQRGTTVTGCYERFGGLIQAGIDGRTMTGIWRENKDQKSGPIVFVVSGDGKKLDALWWGKGQQGKRPAYVWHFEKADDAIGSCPHWKPGIEHRLTRELADEGRARIYGINFDFDSDQIRAESKPLLDGIVEVLKAQPSWKLDVEGHTDSVGGDDYNRDLSQRRAAAVVAYLVSQGIEPARLTAKGFGATQPVASNDDPLGRQQNRRVELVRR